MVSWDFTMSRITYNPAKEENHHQHTSKLDKTSPSMKWKRYNSRTRTKKPWKHSGRIGPRARCVRSNPYANCSYCQSSHSKCKNVSRSLPRHCVPYWRCTDSAAAVAGCSPTTRAGERDAPLADWPPQVGGGRGIRKGVWQVAGFLQPKIETGVRRWAAPTRDDRAAAPYKSAAASASRCLFPPLLETY